MYDNLVKRLRADSDYMDNNGIMLYAAAPFYRECADAIEELSKRASEWETIAESWQKACEGLESRIPRWIPVTERLPEEGMAVLVHAPYKHNHFMAYLLGGAWKTWGPDDSYDRNFPACHYITHWQPLPEPPKEAV